MTPGNTLKPEETPCDVPNSGKPVFFQNPSGKGSIGFPPGFKDQTSPPTPPASDAGSESDVGNVFLAPGVLIRACRRHRFPTMEQLDDIYNKHSKFMLVLVAFTVLTDFFLLSLLAIQQFKHFNREIAIEWSPVFITEVAYAALYVGAALSAYFCACTKKWRLFLYISLAGMALEVLWIPVTWHLNAICFIARGITAMYAKTLVGILNVSESIRVSVTSPLIRQV